MLIDATFHLEVIGKMATSPFQFHLTGSRHFGHERPSSDWDFFVGLDTCELATLHEWLKANDFWKESEHDYRSDVRISEVWAHNGANIHIQIVDNASIKSAVQGVLLATYGRTLGDYKKEHRKTLWNLAYNAYMSACMRLTPADLKSADV